MNRPLKVLASYAAVLLATHACLSAPGSSAGPKRFLWVWLHNLDGRWREFVDFAADRQCTGVVIWGLDGWKQTVAGGKQTGGEAFCRELVAYAHARGVQVIHGFGLNGYHEGRHVCEEIPAANAVIPEHLRHTAKGKASAGNIFCPSNPEALKLLRAMLLRAADTGVDGFNFETADVDYITCHCPTCETRFRSAAETEHENKPPLWSIEQANGAVHLLKTERPGLWLSIEFAMQRFGKPPYLDSALIAQLNRKIDERATLVWAESTYPPQPICEKLAAARRNIGFYVRSAEFAGWTGTRQIKPTDIVGTMRRLWPLHPQCFMYRSWLPLDRWAVNLALAAEAMRDPLQPDARFAEVEADAERMTTPGRKYSRVEKVVPGNLASPAVERTVACSSEDLWRDHVCLTDGVAAPDRGFWVTERNNPREAWAEVRWPKPQQVGRVRVYHQMDGHYRSLDYAIEYPGDDGKWRRVGGMPITDNTVQGWREHVFAPVNADRLRVRITRARHGNRMGIGELEVYGPGPTAAGPQDVADLSPLLEPLRRQFGLPALATAVVKGDRIVAISATGVRKAGSEAPVTVEDRFHIGSCTKSMTATVAAMLVEQGKLAWRTTISEVFPELSGSMDERYREVTLEQLLSHRAGLPTKADPGAWARAWQMRGTPAQQRLEFIRAILAQPPETPPGTKYVYSNQGYAVAGAMLERVTGQAFEDLLRQRLFEPLGMNSAGFGAPASVGTTDQPWGHVFEGGRLKPIPPGPRADNPPAISPAGRVHCALGDLARYVAFHLEKGRGQPALLSPPSFARLHTPFAGQDYALGWSAVKRDWAGGLALTHAGSNTMFYTVVWIAPEKHFAIIVATNLGGDEAARACDRVASTLVRRFAAKTPG